MYKNSTHGQNHTSSYRVPTTTPNTKRKETISKEFNKISAEEMQYKCQQNLCYRCGDKFGVGHQCKPRNLNCLELEKEDKVEFEDAVGEQNEHTDRMGELAKVSLNALFGALKKNSILLQDNLGKLPIKILVDIGSLHSFIHVELAKFLHLPYQNVHPFYYDISK